jgi:hypothetical protein
MAADFEEQASEGGRTDQEEPKAAPVTEAGRRLSLRAVELQGKVAG